jgi:hypothetical protein
VEWSAHDTANIANAVYPGNTAGTLDLSGFMSPDPIPQHDANGGGPKLQDYLSKDITRRGGEKRYVKFAASWLPERTDFRPWFVIGCKRSPSRIGANQRAARGLRRSRHEREHGKTPSSPLTESTGIPDREHGHTYITTAPKEDPPSLAPASSPIQSQSKSRQECPVCWTRWGRSLWAGSCKCCAGFPFQIG